MNSKSLYRTTGQAARQLGISVRTLGRAVDRGEIPCARRTPGGWLLFLPADVDALARRLSDPVTAANQGAVASVPARTVAEAPAALLRTEVERQREAHGRGGDDHQAAMLTMPPALLTALYTHLSYGLIVVDRAGRVVFMNEASTHLGTAVASATEQQARDEPAEPAIEPLLLPHWTLIVRALAGDAVPDVDFVLGRPGEVRYQVIQAAIMALRDTEEQITGAVLTLTDQTDRMGGQAELTRLAATLAQDTREELARTAASLAAEAVTQAQDKRDLTSSNSALEVQATLARVAGAVAQEAREALARTAITLAAEATIQVQDNRDLTRANTALERQAALAENAREALARTAVTLAEEAVTQAQDNRDLTRANAALELDPLGISFFSLMFWIFRNKEGEGWMGA